MEKNRFFTFCFACIPGAGQMYLGMMRKGTLIMGGFMACCILGGMGLVFLLAVLPVLWFYAFFDTWNIRLIPPQIRREEDQRLFPSLSGFFKWDFGAVIQKRHVLVGLGLIFVGLWMIYQTVLGPILRALLESIGNEMAYRVVSRFVYALPSLVVAVAIVLLGINLLRQKRNSKKNAPTEFQEYGGGPRNG